MKRDWIVYAGFMLALAGFLSGISFTAVKWVYSVESRFQRVDDRDHFLHGDFAVNKEK